MEMRAWRLQIARSTRCKYPLRAVLHQPIAGGKHSKNSHLTQAKMREGGQNGKGCEVIPKDKDQKRGNVEIPMEWMTRHSVSSSFFLPFAWLPTPPPPPPNGKGGKEVLASDPALSVFVNHCRVLWYLFHFCHSPSSILTTAF